MLLLATLLVLELAGSPYGVIEDVFYATMIPFGLVPYLFLAGLARAQMLRGGAVGRLVASLGEPLGSGELRDALSRALGDPSWSSRTGCPSRSSTSTRRAAASSSRVRAPGGRHPP